MQDETICKVKGWELSVEAARDMERWPWREKGKCKKSRAEQRLARCSQRCVTLRMSKEEGELDSASDINPNIQWHSSHTHCPASEYIFEVGKLFHNSLPQIDLSLVLLILVAHGSLVLVCMVHLY